MTNILNIKARCMRLCLVCCALFFSLLGWGQVNWGPNALPVIDMSSGETTENLSVEVSTSYYSGYKGDISVTPNLLLNIPLFTRWVNLEAWYSVMDFHTTKEQTQWHSVAGDIYASTNIQILHTEWFNLKQIPSALVRIGLKTASGGDTEHHRFIDAPGYFIDLTIAEKIEWQNKWAKSLSFAASIGFFCWQTDKTEQNDAYMYGVKTKFEAQYLRVIAEWGGYTGWQNNGDKPMSIKAKIGIPCPLGLEPYIAYQYGIKDWQYNEFRIGLKYSINSIKGKKL